jgi:hypothetical protein
MFGSVQQSGHEELAGASPLAVNVIVDAVGAVHRRPGLFPRSDGDLATGPEFVPDQVSAVSPIVALHSTAKGRVFAVDAPAPFSRIYELKGMQVVNHSEVSDELLGGGRRPTIAETEAIVVFAAGGLPVKLTLNGSTVVSLLGGGPPQGSHVIAQAERLLMNDVVSDSPNTVRYSRTASGSSYAGHEDWRVDIEDLGAGGGFTASARPDPVVALHENTNEVFAFGTTNLQIYTANPNAHDPARDYVFIPGNTREFGCSAPYSIIKYDQNFAFIDQYRRIMMTDGREFQYLSQDIQQTLDDISDLSDAFGYRVTLGPVDALCWSSPRAGRTFAFQLPTKSWSLWLSWDNGTNNFYNWLVRCAIRVPETGEMLVGGPVQRSTGPTGPITPASVADPATGDVYALNNHRFYDFYPTNKIVARVDTGFIDRGTSGRKLCRALRMTWRGTPSTDTSATLEWRDDGGSWEHPRQIEIGYNSEVILRSLGVYRRRQWRVTFSGQNELVLARAEEEYELLSA